MATVRTIGEQYLRRLLVESGDATPEADELQDFMHTMNRYMAAQEANGIKLGFTQLTDLTDEITVPDGALMGVGANVAILVAADYARPVPPSLIAEAAMGLSAMRKLGRSRIQLRYPADLPMGSGNYSPRLDDPFYEGQAQALLSLSGNATATAIASSNTPVLVAGEWGQRIVKGFLGDITGRITSVLNNAVTAQVKAEIVATTAASNACTFHIYKNGVSVATTTATLSSTQSDVVVSASMDIDPGDYVELWVENDAGTGDVTVADCQFRVS